jgi:type IV secretion system protein VirB6
MGFFAEFAAWLNTLLETYVTDTSTRLAHALEPAIVTLGAIYVMTWGLLHLSGKVEEPILEGLRRIATLAMVFGVSLDLWLYHDVVVDVFFNAPGQVAAAAINAPDYTTVVDTILDRGDDVGGSLLAKSGTLHWNLAYDVAAIAVYLTIGIVAVYAMFLLSLSKIALSVLLALGPMIIPLFLFDSTRRFVESWLAQLANYGFVAVLSALVAALMMTVIDQAAAQAESVGGDIQIAHAIRICLAAGLTFLVLRQVLPISSALASGIALSTYGVVSSTLARGAGRALGGSNQFMRGALLDKETTRWDPLARKAGFLLGEGVRTVRGKVRNFFGVGSNSIGS